MNQSAIYPIVRNSQIERSQRKALLVPEDLIDGRSERDMLAYLSRFASLIRFYDQTNRPNGTWAPFLLKDGLFRLALISRYDLEQWTAVFAATIKHIQQQLQQISLPPPSKPDWTVFGRVFEELFVLFDEIASWSADMLNSLEEYDLKKYVLERIQKRYSAVYWALGSMTLDINGVAGFTVFYREQGPQAEQFNAPLWHANKNLRPYWEVLPLRQAVGKSTPKQILHALKATGKQLAGFVRSIILAATEEFSHRNASPSPYPDTALVRVFVKLLAIQQKQLNTIAGKHLQFYYEKILGQKPLAALPDRTFLHLRLANSDASFELDRKATFFAGTDAREIPILFHPVRSSNLNPAQVTSALTLHPTSKKASPGGLLLHKIGEPSVVHKDEDGTVRSWNPFGSSGTGELKRVGFAIASPMLYLKQGARTLTVSLTFTDGLPDQLFNGAIYELSTAEAWLPVKPESYAQTSNKKVTITFKIARGTSPIEAFAEHPDGLDTKWPMLRITFRHLPNPEDPPKVTAIEIKAKVAKMKDVFMLNDSGPVEGNLPFQLLGPIAQQGNNFYLGSPEIFSKPLDDFQFTFSWQGLPKNFYQYYLLYNLYLIFNSLNKLSQRRYRKRRGGLKNLFKHTSLTEKLEKLIPCQNAIFRNKAFKVSFSILSQGDWHQITFKDWFLQTTLQPLFESVPGKSKACSESRLRPKSTFAFPSSKIPQFVPKPELQLRPLVFGEEEMNGFFRLSLQSPALGFGQDLYPKVLEALAMLNGYLISKGKLPFPGEVNPPYSPEVNHFEISYAATRNYELTEAFDYPLQCFQYTPFAAFKVYDNLQSRPVACALYPKYNDSGQLYLSLAELVVPGELNLYFEVEAVANSYPALQDSGLVCEYLSESSWKPLTVLSDSTRQLSGTGILCFQLESDVATSHPSMPQGLSWLRLSPSGKQGTFGNVVFLSANGVEVERVKDNTFSLSETLEIPAGTIESLRPALPGIASVEQPFASFGGRKAEGREQMYERVSMRIGTRDRVVSRNDFPALVRTNFPGIFQSEVIFDRREGEALVFVLPLVDDRNAPGAFAPQASLRKMEEIGTFLQERAPINLRVRVLNYPFACYTIAAKIRPEKAGEGEELSKRLSLALRVHFSPWIGHSGTQRDVNRPAGVAQVVAFASKFPGVKSVKDVQIIPAINPQPKDSPTVWLPKPEFQLQIAAS